MAGRGRAAEDRAKLILTAAMWAASFAIFTAGSLLAGTASPTGAALLRAAMALFGIALCYGLHRLLRRLADRPFRVRALVAAGAAPFAAEVFAWVNYFAVEIRNGRPARISSIDWYDAAQVLSAWTWFFVAWAGLYLAIEYSFEARREARRAAELRTMAQEAKLRALSSQINPHFLFNSLNSISALILEGRAREAEKMLAQLSTFFRSSLAIDPMVEIDLAREFELHRRYLAIEKMRYPDLEFVFDLPPDLERAAVPALILQPLVENAVKHGVARSLPPTAVRISAERFGDSLVLVVWNQWRAEGSPDERKPPGIGVANVRQRLEEYFGPDQSLSLRPTDDGFEARLTMPLRLT